MQRSREALLPFVLIGLVCLGASAYFLRGVASTGRERVHYEDLALARLRALAEAETRFHAASGKYGWVEDLQQDGLLQDFGVGRDPLAGAGAETYLTSPRYRLDVLLPHTITRSDHVVIATRRAGKRNLELEGRYFCVVARPWGDQLTGLRTYALDDTGRVYVSEGVSDESSLITRPLPELHLSHGDVTVSGGLRWYPLDELPER